MPAEARADAKKSAIEKAKTRYLPVFEKVLTENGTGLLVGSEATIADCALFNTLSFMKEMSEYNNILDDFPKCKAFLDTFSAIPGVKKYLESPRRFPIPDDAYAKEVIAALF
ncbi:putative glutathione S-transferase alpha-4 isoform X1 [Apostichopus japonicus]|uniref:Putative glutathione S-transferase alpha-4 isoform X1 n=2 Tax=Stichopus japonicus TaxID=307972 RepID=A0A2G8K1V2_STIJA|nr:putative glutathione S-transferase alpha-4 isoform X1 [Apostichopus japonicus]